MTAPTERIDIDDPASWPDISLTPEEAKAAPSESGFGMMLNGWTAFFPGIPCIHCGRFIGRDGHLSIEHFEMSSQIASIDGECGRCQETCRGCNGGGIGSGGAGTCATCGGEGVTRVERR